MFGLGRLFLCLVVLPTAGAEVSARSFEEYAKDSNTFTDTGNDQLRAAVASAEANNKDKVVLYTVMPLHGYLMAWLAQGVTAKQLLKWKGAATGVVSELPLQLRSFAAGQDFPSFAPHNASVCSDFENRKMRDADPEEAKILGDGDWANYNDFSPLDMVKKTGPPFKISYQNQQKEYPSCRELVYSRMAEENDKVAPLMEAAALEAAGVSSGKDFAKYLDDKVGPKWQDAAFPQSYDGLPTVGVQDRLLQAQINLLGQAISSDCLWDRPSAWEYFTYYEDVFGDLYRDQLGRPGSQADWGARSGLLEQVLESSSPEVRTKVDNLVSLLRCAAQMRFPIYRQNFGRRQQIMKECWTGTSKLFPPDSGKLNLDTVASARTKAATEALERGGLETQQQTRGFSRVLLQVVLPPEVAKQLAYVSTDWKNKSGPPPGHEHEEWRGVDFVEAYNVLKNAAGGDAVTARVLLRNGPFSRGKLLAYSQVFKDPAFMEMAQSLLNDILQLIAGPIKEPEEEPGGWTFLQLAGLFLAAGLALFGAFLGYRRSRLRRANEQNARDVELPEQPLRSGR